MKREESNRILHEMSSELNNRQMLRRSAVMEDIRSSSAESVLKPSAELMESFLATKRLEGRSEKTLGLYRFSIGMLIEKVEKHVCTLTTDDIRNYLTGYQSVRGVSKSTLDNIRRNLSSFFRWLEDEDFIYKSPLRRIHKVKTQITVKEAYSDEELERLRDGCRSIRNLAIIDFLNSTGIRIGELVRLNREDIDFTERECIVLGKGDKERIAYFDARAKLHLEDYLQSRKDDNPALFVSIRKPATRLTSCGVETMLRKMGVACNVPNCHPHRFRRTLATMAIDKGMPIEQVQSLLGHEQIATTLRYALVRQSNVKISHKKYIG
jgi:site-specific recombinase XerD